MTVAILDHFRQLINVDMERRLALNHHFFKTHALTQLLLEDNFLHQAQTTIQDCLHLLHDLVGQAARDNDFALSELADNEHLCNVHG